MLSLALRTLRHRRAGFAGALVALFFAAALVGACGVLLETGLRGSVATERYAGTPLIVAGDQNAHAVMHKKGKLKKKAKPLAEHGWIPESTADTVRLLHGVRSVVPEVDFPASVVVDGQPVTGPHGSQSWGHGWQSATLTPFTLRDGRAPAAPGDLVVDAGLAEQADIRVGSAVTVHTTRGPARYRVVGVVVAGRSSRNLDRQAALFFTTAQARTLAGHPGQIRALGVLPENGVAPDDLRERISRAVSSTGARIYTGDARGSLEFLDASKARVMLISLAGSLGGASLLVAILVVVGTFALTIQQRQREIALLRAIAATPRQVRAMIGREALVVGAVASVLGCAASIAVATWLHTRLVDAGVIPGNLRMARSPLPLFAAVGTTMIAGWVAARAAARRTVRIRPTEALTEAAVAPARPGVVRILAGVVVLVGALVLTAVLSGLSTEPAATPVTFLTSLLWVIASTLLGPLIMRPATAILSPPLRRLSSVSGYLAAANTRTASRRLATVVAPLSLAVAMTCTILFAQTTLGHAAQRQVHEGVTADYVLRAPAPGIPATVPDAVRKVPGIGAVTQVVHTTARGFGLARYSVQGVTPDHLAQNLDLDTRAGSLAQLRDDTAALSTNAADASGAQLGGLLRLWLGDGTPVTLKVVAIYARGLGFSDLTLSHSLVAAHVDDPLDESVLIKSAPGTAGVKAALARRLRDYPGVHLLDQSQTRAQQATRQRANTKIQYLVMGLIIAFTAIAVVNTLMMATADRTREFALLRLVGTTRRQIRRMTNWESLVVTLIAVCIGTATSVIALSAFSAGMTGAPPHIPPLTYLGVAGTAALLVLLTSELATRVAMRNHPAEVISSWE